MCYIKEKGHNLTFCKALGEEIVDKQQQHKVELL